MELNPLVLPEEPPDGDVVPPGGALETTAVEGAALPPLILAKPSWVLVPSIVTAAMPSSATKPITMAYSDNDCPGIAV
jgi:hypothetical protein